MKYYYNGKLMRTSKNHHYTHAVINPDGDRLIGCCSRLDLAVKLRQSYISECETSIENFKRAIKALEAGKNKYWCKCGNRDVLEKTYYTIDEYKKYIENSEKKIAYRKNFKVVELEERE